MRWNFIHMWMRIEQNITGGLWLISTCIYYFPPTKLGKGNAFSHVCHSVQGVPCDHYPWCTRPHHSGIPPDIGPHCTWTPQDMFNLFNLKPHCTGTYPSPGPSPQVMYRIFSYEAHTAGLYPIGMLSCWYYLHVHHNCPFIREGEFRNKTSPTQAI